MKIEEAIDLVASGQDLSKVTDHLLGLDEGKASEFLQGMTGQPIRAALADRKSLVKQAVTTYPLDSRASYAAAALGRSTGAQRAGLGTTAALGLGAVLGARALVRHSRRKKAKREAEAAAQAAAAARPMARIRRAAFKWTGVSEDKETRRLAARRIGGEFLSGMTAKTIRGGWAERKRDLAGGPASPGFPSHATVARAKFKSMTGVQQAGLGTTVGLGLGAAALGASALLRRSRRKKAEREAEARKPFNRVMRWAGVNEGRRAS